MHNDSSCRGRATPSFAPDVKRSTPGHLKERQRRRGSGWAGDAGVATIASAGRAGAGARAGLTRGHKHIAALHWTDDAHGPRMLNTRGVRE